ncbi:hypothetical protein G9A89_001936 [Geosiphon pyriformis]|nr:hypothetical protein G9A89_001936 [Geosiphon pyriformis]
MFEELDFQQIALSENEVAAPRSNPSNKTIPSAQIAQNTNLSDIFPFEFEANKSPFLFSNAAVNEQKAITAMYTEAEMEKKPIQLILNSGSAETDDIKKTPVEEINNFPFTIDGITIPVKVLVMDVSQYQALKALVFEFEKEKELPVIETFMALRSTFNWAKETEQKIFEETRE